MKTIVYWISLICLSSPLLASPWGKDADLVTSSSYTPPPCSKKSALASYGIKAIRFHQEVISPADGPRSHFIPSSSQYTLEAIQTHGFFTGFWMGCDRLMRENDEAWVYRKIQNQEGIPMKWDPIPRSRF